MPGILIIKNDDINMHDPMHSIDLAKLKKIFACSCRPTRFGSGQVGFNPSKNEKKKREHHVTISAFHDVEDNTMRINFEYINDNIDAGQGSYILHQQS